MNLDQPLTLADRLEQAEERKKKDAMARSVENAAKEGLKAVWDDLARKHNLRAVHVPYRNGEIDDGGYTLVWAPTLPGGRVVQIAVALQNPGDEYNRIIGRAIAAGRFESGQRITVRVARSWADDVSGYLTQMFRM